MKRTEQRQDLLFLALAVAVLAIAVALFVGMKGLPQSKKNAPAAPPKEVAEPTGEVAKGSKGAARDPFSKQGGAAKPIAPVTGSGGKTAEPELKFYGIVSEKDDPPVAIIHSTKKRYYARVGDRVAGYTLIQVGMNEAVLEKDGNRVTLLLREPEPADE